MTTTTIAATARIAELTADLKRVYKSGGDPLVALADKYGATSKSLSFYRSEPERAEGYVSFGVAVTASKSSLAELQRATYGAIKAQLRQAGA